MLIFFGSFLIPDTDQIHGFVRLDFTGTILAFIGLFVFLIGTSKVSEWGLIKAINAPFTIFGLSPAIPMMILGIVILVLLLKVEEQVEKEHGFALIPQYFIKNRQVRNGLYASAFIFLIMGAYSMVIISYLQIMEGFNATQSSLSTVCLGIALFLVSFLTPKFAGHLNSKTILRLGYFIVTLSIIPISLSIGKDGTNIPLMFLGIVIMGIGEGFVSARANIVVAEAVNQRDSQQSAGIQATSRNVSQAFGAAFIGSFLIFFNDTKY